MAEGLHASALRAAMLDAEVALIELMRNRQAMRSLSSDESGAHLPVTACDGGSLPDSDSDNDVAAVRDSDENGRQLVRVPAPVAICARCGARWVTIDGSGTSPAEMFDRHVVVGDCQVIQ